MPIIEGHHDFGVLEQRLASYVRDAPTDGDGGLPVPVAILAPTRRLLTYLQVRIAATLGARLNLHFFHHHSLARAAAAWCGTAPARILSEGVAEALIRHMVRREGGPLAAHLTERPGTARALRRTLDDLREAGVDPDACLSLEGWSRTPGAVLKLYAAYARHLDSLSPRGLTDRAGFLRLLLSQVKAFGRRFPLILHYGAYELIGGNRDLMRALEDSGSRVVYLTLYHHRSPAYVHAGRFWCEILKQAPEVLPDSESDRLLGDRLQALYDEQATDLSTIPISAFHAQGAEAELREVALRILALHRDHGTPLSEMAVIARSLQPYASSLRPVFEEHGLPFVTHATTGAVRDPGVQAALQLVRTALRDFERRPLMDLLRGGRLRLHGRDPSREAHGWDRLSRRFRVTSGYTAWTRDLPAWVEDWRPDLPLDATEEERARFEELKARRRRQARALAASVRSLARALKPVSRANSWTTWSRALEGACRALLCDFQSAAQDEEAASNPAAESVLDLLAQMRDLEAAGVPFSPGEALDFFQSGLGAAAMTIGPAGEQGPGPGRDNGGVRVLDAMQARGLSFEAVFLIGLNADLIPRREREDPFLGDLDRLRLRERLRLPLPVGSRAPEEERLLLAHLLGAPRKWLTLSWQRADATGRAKVPSLALREVARLTCGHAQARSLIEGARRLSSHPGQGAAEARDEHRLLPVARARLGSALQLGSPDPFLRDLDRLPGPSDIDHDLLHAGLRMLSRIEDFASHDLRYDACVDEAASPVALWSPSRLELLGRCPQRYFFRYVLHIEEMEEVLEGYELLPHEIGSHVHAVLRELYAGLGRQDTRLAAALVDDLPSAWRRHTADLSLRLGTRYPVFWQSTEALWLAALRRFLERDLADLTRSRASVLGAEEEARAPLPMDGGKDVEIRGRFDRIARRGDGTIVVSDYKTSGDLQARVRLTSVLKGTQLQLPLYVLMAEALAPTWGASGAPVEAEILGVGPKFQLPRGVRRSPEAECDDPARVALEARTFGDIRAPLLETLAVLLDLAAAGSFPLHADRWCRHCPFTRACRRSHTPTLSRLEAAPRLADYRNLSGKSTRAPFLSDVASGGGKETEP